MKKKLTVFYAFDFSVLYVDDKLIETNFTNGQANVLEAVGITESNYNYIKARWPESNKWPDKLKDAMEYALTN